ncbi:MAG: hypothetical protein QXN97_06955 [Desulfurococcaceae archaeon]
MGIRVKLVEKREDSLARILRVETRRASFITPNHAVSLNVIDNIDLTSEHFKGIAEIPFEIRLDNADKIIESSKLRERKASRFKYLLNKAPDDQVIVAIPILNRGKLNVEQLEESKLREYIQQFVEILVAPRVDIVCAPVFQRLPEKIYVKIIEEFVDYISLLNVIVAPSIPYTSRATLSEITRLYERVAGKVSNFTVNFLCVDYNGSNPVSKYSFHNYILALSKSMERDRGEPVALYGVNVKYSRVATKYSELPARDLASYFIGVDLVGSNHKRPIIQRQIIEILKPGVKPKLLIREDYTYVDAEVALQRHEDPLILKIAELVKMNIKKSSVVAKKYNMRETLMEAGYLRERVFKSTSDIHPLSYLMSKKAVNLDERMKTIVHEVTQRFTKIRPLKDYA